MPYYKGKTPHDRRGRVRTGGRPFSRMFEYTDILDSEVSFWNVFRGEPPRPTQTGRITGITPTRIVQEEDAE